ncbi:hypothetical protein H5410_043536 [Solanum commersonii]|uniref:Uncharacterized protein n=1 Tax=Solanum commersonii TaxID=4109 RepID=A0A9J5Y1N9_SOLCO|nr:hypothetical protein H5410_043536 [Solanum commersonii]
MFQFPDNEWKDVVVYKFSDYTMRKDIRELPSLPLSGFHSLIVSCSGKGGNGGVGDMATCERYAQYPVLALNCRHYCRGNSLPCP